MGFPYGAGGKTLPKAGRLGSGSFFPGKGHHASIDGNVFGANWDQPARANAASTGARFGDPNQALLSTTAVGRAANSPPNLAQYPRDSHFQTATYNKLSALASGSSGSGNDTSPVGIRQNKDIQPWEKTTFSIGRANIKRPPFRASGGVNNSFKQDTAFQRKQPKAVAKTPPPANFDTTKVHGAQRPAVGSFQVGHSGQMWGDPNQSFIAGVKNSTNGRVGFTRWSTVKRGAAG